MRPQSFQKKEYSMVRSSSNNEGCSWQLCAALDLQKTCNTISGSQNQGSAIGVTPLNPARKGREKNQVRFNFHGGLKWIMTEGVKECRKKRLLEQYKKKMRGRRGQVIKGECRSTTADSSRVFVSSEVILKNNRTAREGKERTAEEQDPAVEHVKKTIGIKPRAANNTAGGGKSGGWERWDL